MRSKLYILCVQIGMLFYLGGNSVAVSASAFEPYLGEVRWFAGNFAPRGWAFCDGQLLTLAQNTALFSLLGTNYGGDGRSTFGLPDMRGRGMMHAGRGPGLTPRQLGQKSGAESVVMNEAELPSHTHALKADSTGGDSILPNDRVISKAGRLKAFAPAAGAVDMGATAVENAGGSQGHNNMQPYVTANCIIALVGVYPSQN